MDNETLFYVLGGLLVVIALVVSFAGLRFDKFPASKGLLVGGTLAVTVLVGATVTFAWRSAEDEQAHREAELAEEVAAHEEEGDTTEADEEAGPDVGDELAAAGAQVFSSAGCGGCHTLADAGTTATTGPDLDGALQGEDEAFIRESIVDPNKTIEEGFAPDIMPQGYGTDLSPEDLDALVAYLSQATSG
jgi:mono/diheme cytochrome c family protein